MTTKSVWDGLRAPQKPWTPPEQQRALRNLDPGAVPPAVPPARGASAKVHAAFGVGGTPMAASRLRQDL